MEMSLPDYTGTRPIFMSSSEKKYVIVYSVLMEGERKSGIFV